MPVNSELNKSKSKSDTWNLHDPCFDWKGPSFGGFKPQNRGQTSSRYILSVELPTPSINMPLTSNAPLGMDLALLGYAVDAS